jgi:hypothetical protein
MPAKTSYFVANRITPSTAAMRDGRVLWLLHGDPSSRRPWRRLNRQWTPVVQGDGNTQRLPRR